MRRCDRELLLILYKWTPVEVVMTQYTIVYFGPTISYSSPVPVAEEMRESLITTNGWKQRRLLDGVAGRRIISLLLLTAIQSTVVDC
jgi:hypothetical protein